MRGWVQRAAFFLAIGGFFILSIALRNGAVSIYDKMAAEDERYYLPPPAWLKVFAAGYNEAVADLIWTKTLVYFGRHFSAKSGTEKNQFTINYLTTVSHLDPMFRRLYVVGHALTLFQHRDTTEASVKAAIELLERGVSFFPHDGEILFELGFMHYYEMRPFVPKEENDPQRRHHKETGAQLIRRAALLENTPPYVANLATALLRKEGFNELIVEHLKAMLIKETNPEVRKTLIKSLRKELGKAAERDIKISEKLVAEWKSSLPFVSYDLYLIMRSEVSIGELIDPLSWTNALLGLDDETLAAEEFRLLGDPVLEAREPLE